MEVDNLSLRAMYVKGILRKGWCKGKLVYQEANTCQQKKR